MNAIRSKINGKSFKVCKRLRYPISKQLKELTIICSCDRFIHK